LEHELANRSGQMDLMTMYLLYNLAEIEFRLGMHDLMAQHDMEALHLFGRYEMPREQGNTLQMPGKAPSDLMRDLLVGSLYTC
jgi:hypothetical protein